jgi:PAS domain S-box-containing protein/putative nucleotidyltransferase with HDIG domain
MERWSRQSTLRIVLLYALFGMLWITASDRLLELLVADPHRITVIQTYKGWGFVFASAVVIYFAARRELQARERAERKVKESEEKYRALIENANDAILVFDADAGLVIEANKRAVALLGLPVEKLVGLHYSQLHPPEDSEQCRSFFDDAVRQGALVTDALCVFHVNGRKVPVEISTNVLTLGGKRIVQGAFRDITVRRLAEENARVRLERLDTLHAIDLIISSSLDLHITLLNFIDHVLAQFHVDAADVLLLNPHTLLLEYAAKEHRGIAIADLRDPGSGFLRSPLLAGEGFIAYYASPLLAKGRSLGVLEILHRSPLHLDDEQKSFLEALAAQAAIAIDNAALFDELQRSNIELSLAYDATLEGWARALDLRSEATERHTERVTEMTMRLARAMGIGEKELVHVRRGALLHDIGKIAVPDSILLKAGPLTAEEQEIMRRHPVHAFEMLLPIAYLRPALDIPYCHHERWDGAGYPRGLKGERIPLAARIFTVADVWDALYATDRPYRKPLPRDAVREHIRSLAGTHLDPKAVEEFLKLEW